MAKLGFIKVKSTGCTYWINPRYIRYAVEVEYDHGDVLIVVDKLLGDIRMPRSEWLEHIDTDE